MASQKDVKNRIASVKNIHKITRAMEMVAAARLRRAEQRIARLRPYADAIRRMSREVSEAAGNVPQLPILRERENLENVGLLLISGDRGLAGSFNSNILRRGLRAKAEFAEDGAESIWYAVGRRGASSLNFRGEQTAKSYIGITDRPTYANAREIAEDLMAAYTDQKLDRVELVYNRYVTPLTQIVTRQTLLPLQQAAVTGEDSEEAPRATEPQQGTTGEQTKFPPLWLYEPDPEEILAKLVPDYVEVSVFRALLESTASEHGARMTAMRSAAENAEEMIDDLTLEANRVRQAEITQEIMEVISGAEALG